MSNDIPTGIARLEHVLAFLKEQDFEDWQEAAEAARAKAKETGNKEWQAVEALIIVATHGAPEQLSYMDKEWTEFLDKEIRDSDTDR